MPKEFIDPAKLQFHLAPPAGYLFDIEERRHMAASWVFMADLGPDLRPWQGDYIDDGSMAWVGDGGVIVEYRGPLVLTSHGCDTEPNRDPSATVAPAIDLDVYLDAIVRRAALPAAKESHFRETQRGAITSSQIRHTFYLPATHENPAQVVDFGFIGSLAVDELLRQFNSADRKRRMRLTANGHRLFACKLAAHFARGEDRGDYPRAP